VDPRIKLVGLVSGHGFVGSRARSAWISGSGRDSLVSEHQLGLREISWCLWGESIVRMTDQYISINLT
jgi:hypothetical protein